MKFASLAALRAAQGRPLGSSEWVTLSQEDVAAFAGATRAEEWIHVDEERARRESPFGTTVAHGYLTLSLATHVLTEMLEVDGYGLGVNYGLDRVRFPAPVPVGARVRATGTLLAAEDDARGVRTTTELVFTCDGADRPVCVAEVVSLLLPGS